MEHDWQPDPEYAEYLREAQAPLNENDTFLKTYGFEHHCRCAEDYVEGNVGTVSDCWANMCSDALATCAFMKGEIDRFKIIVAELQTQLNELGVAPRA